MQKRTGGRITVGSPSFPTILGLISTLFMLQTGEGNPWLRTRDMSSRHSGRRDGLVLATKSVRSPLEQP